MKRFLIFASILGLISTLSCGGSATNSNSLAGSSANLRRLQGSGDVAGFDVQLDGHLFMSATDKTPSQFRAVSQGSHRLDVVLPGGTVSLASVSVSMAPNSNQTLVVAGAVEDNTMTAFVVAEDRTPPPSGQMKLRFVHGAHDAGTINIYVANAADAFSTTPTFANVDYKTATTVLVRPFADYKLCWVPASGGGLLGPGCTTVETVKVGAMTPTNTTFLLVDAPISPSAPPGTFGFVQFFMFPD